MMSADGPGNTYQLLERSYGIEVPDCKHMVPHMTEVMDDELKRPVFVFHAHVNQDDDRCMNSDRQRTEIRGRASGVQGPEGSTRHYRWLMKLPAGFQPSGNFTHVFQIKAYGNGHGSGAPIMTLTPRNGTFGIDGRIGTRASTQLSNVLNQWVIIELTIVHSNGGRLAMTIKRWRDGMMLLSYSGNGGHVRRRRGLRRPQVRHLPQPEQRRLAARRAGALRRLLRIEHQRRRVRRRRPAPTPAARRRRGPAARRWRSGARRGSSW